MSARRIPYTEADRISARKIREYMQAEVTDHVDPLTGEVNSTALAEDACSHFNAYEGNEIPERFFELANLIGERHEIKTGISQPRIGANLAGLINSLESDWF